MAMTQEELDELMREAGVDGVGGNPLAILSPPVAPAVSAPPVPVVSDALPPAALAPPTRDLSALARAQPRAASPAATTYSPVAESLSPDLRTFGNTAADRKWFASEMGKIDTNTPEGYARSRELRAMEPDFSQRMDPAEMSKMDAGFQAIARVPERPLLPEKAPPPLPPTYEQRSREMALREREARLAALARGPQPSDLDRARAEAERAKAGWYGRRDVKGGGAGAGGAAPTMAGEDPVSIAQRSYERAGIEPEPSIIASVQSARNRKELDAAFRRMDAHIARERSANVAREREDRQQEKASAPSAAQQKASSARNTEVQTLRELEGRLAARVKTDPGGRIPNKGNMLQRGITAGRASIAGGSGMSAEDTALDTDLGVAGLSAYIGKAGNAPNTKPEQDIAQSLFRGDGTYAGALARVQARLKAIDAMRRGESVTDELPGVIGGAEGVATPSADDDGRAVIKRQRNKRTGQVRVVYSDGTTEVVDG